jgi:hypothetical protein
MRRDLMINSPYILFRLFKIYNLLTTTKFYSFKAHIPILTSISSFAVAIVNTGGRNQIYDNNGKWFPISDGVMVQTPQSCVKSGRLNVSAAVCFARENIVLS